jgi:Uncharacterized protein conserved in bacteria (DUF2184)
MQKFQKEHKVLTHRSARSFYNKDGSAKVFDVPNSETAAVFDSLEKLGIDFDGRDVKKMAMACGMDSMQQGLTVSSIGIPVQFLQSWMAGVVRIQTAPRKMDEITGVDIVGRNEDEEIIQAVSENLGTATPYTDDSNVPLANLNLTYERRSIVRFESGLKVGLLSNARLSAINIDEAQEKRLGCSSNLEDVRNQIGFFGHNNGLNRIYGLLNEPSLGAYTTVPNGAAASPLWNLKDILEIINDIRNAIQKLRVQSNDRIDPKTTDITLLLPTNVVDRLSVASSFGYSVQEWLTKTYPRIRVVSAPQLNTANGGASAMYLFAETVEDNSTDNGKTFMQLVPQKLKLLGVMQELKGYIESYVNALAGVLLKRPFAVVRFTGI